MRQSLLVRLNIIFSFFIALLSISVSRAQMSGKIDLSKDTISKADAVGARNTYLNNLRGHGNKATERINLPVDKLKEIMDACTANNITDISVMVITIRQNDLVQARKQNPGATDDQLKGNQMLVFRVPRKAFPGAMGTKVNLPGNPLVLSLLGAGLVLLDSRYTGLPAGDDLFFGLGSICPPPTSCD